VLFISGAASPTNLATMARNGAAFLEKPFSADMLAKKVHEVLS